MRPAVCSGYSSRFSTLRGFLAAHQVEDRRRQVLRQVVDDGRGVVGRQLLDEARDLLGGPIGEQRGAGLRADLAERLHGELAVSLEEQRERGMALALLERAEDLREVGRVLFLQQIQQVRGGPDTQQPLDRVEDDVQFSLLRHVRPRECTKSPYGSTAVRQGGTPSIPATRPHDHAMQRHATQLADGPRDSGRYMGRHPGDGRTRPDQRARADSAPPARQCGGVRRSPSCAGAGALPF